MSKAKTPVAPVPWHPCWLTNIKPPPLQPQRKRRAFTTHCCSSSMNMTQLVSPKLSVFYWREELPSLCSCPTPENIFWTCFDTSSYLASTFELASLDWVKTSPCSVWLSFPAARKMWAKRQTLWAVSSIFKFPSSRFVGRWSLLEAVDSRDWRWMSGHRWNASNQRIERYHEKVNSTRFGYSRRWEFPATVAVSKEFCQLPFGWRFNHRESTFLSYDSSRFHYYCPRIAGFVWLQLRLDTIDGRNELWMWWERKWISMAHQRSASRSHSESFKRDCGDGIKSSNQNKFWKTENVARDSHFDWGS